MVPSVSVMCTASRTTVTFSTCAYFVGSIAGEERAFQTAAASEGAGICADTDAEARIAKRVTSVALLSMVAPPPTDGKKVSCPLVLGKRRIGYIAGRSGH